MNRTGTEPFLLHPSAARAVARAPRLRPAFAGWYPRFGFCAALVALVAFAAVAFAAAQHPSAAPDTFAGALGGALVVSAALGANAVQSLRYERRRVRLLTEGRAVPGRVVRCAGREVVVPPGREDGQDEVRRLAVVDCEYEFDSPSGAPVSGTDGAVRDDLAGGGALPPPGHPVLILWLTDELFVLL